MSYIGYTLCADGSRWFAHVSGLCISYDRRLIANVIEFHRQELDTAKKIVDTNKQFVEDNRTPLGLPASVDHALEHNERRLQSHIHETKRLAAAEAVIGEQLVRSVAYFEKIEDAINYSQGPQS